MYCIQSNSKHPADPTQMYIYTQVHSLGNQLEWVISLLIHVYKGQEEVHIRLEKVAYKSGFISILMCSRSINLGDSDLTLHKKLNNSAPLNNITGHYWILKSLHRQACYISNITVWESLIYIQLYMIMIFHQLLLC